MSAPSGPRLSTYQLANAMHTALAVDGGFTYDATLRRFYRPGDNDAPIGFAIAIPDTEASIDELQSMVDETNFLLNMEGREVFIGGWYDDTNKLWLELSEVLDIPRDKAIQTAKGRDQLAILDMQTGELIDTSGS